MGLTSNVSETLAIFERALKQRNTILGTECLNNVLKMKLFSLRDTRRIKFSQSHSLNRLSCSVASGRPNARRGFTEYLKSTFSFPSETPGE